MRIALVAAAVVAIGALSACGASMHHSSSGEDRPSQQRPASPPPMYALDLDFVRSNGAIDSVQVDVKAPIKDASVELRVLRGLAERTVVFDGVFQMSDIALPPDGPMGVVALSTWSGSLSPNDWEGGCDHEQYRISSITQNETKDLVETSEAPAFWCR